MVRSLSCTTSTRATPVSDARRPERAEERTSFNLMNPLHSSSRTQRPDLSLLILVPSSLVKTPSAMECDECESDMGGWRELTFSQWIKPNTQHLTATCLGCGLPEPWLRHHAQSRPTITPRHILIRPLDRVGNF